jgi:FtsP/CotA-like multicopper oxidase with cupredoxin domain
MQVRMSVLANTVGKWVSSTWSRKTILWDYASFGRTGAAVPVPDATIEMVFTKDNAAVNGFNRWLINGTAFSMERMQPVFTVQRQTLPREDAQRERRHPSDALASSHVRTHEDRRPIDLRSTEGRRHARRLSGLELDFTADNPGLSLSHCHMQLHMDY